MACGVAILWFACVQARVPVSLAHGRVALRFSGERGDLVNVWVWTGVAGWTVGALLERRFDPVHIYIAVSN